MQRVRWREYDDHSTAYHKRVALGVEIAAAVAFALTIVAVIFAVYPYVEWAATVHDRSDLARIPALTFVQVLCACGAALCVLFLRFVTSHAPKRAGRPRA